VTGTKTGVTPADRILVTVRTDRGPAVAIVDPAGPGVTFDGPLLRLHQARGRPLGDGGTPARHDGDSWARCHADLHRYALAGACALADGALAGALALTAEHVRTRHQFGRPLASFQAVAQQIADVYITGRTLHLAALTAAWRLGVTAAGHEQADDDLHVAAQWCTAEAPAAVRICHHLHGGLGLAADYPLHRYTALIRATVRFLGGSEYRLQTLGERLVHRPD
jgi:alkylation response protein AidB-like acyl-CoA dehydrogenase